MLVRQKDRETLYHLHATAGKYCLHLLIQLLIILSLELFLSIIQPFFFSCPSSKFYVMKQYTKVQKIDTSMLSLYTNVYLRRLTT